MENYEINFENIPLDLEPDSFSSLCKYHTLEIHELFLFV